MNLNKPVGILILAGLIAVLGISAILLGLYFLTFLPATTTFSDRVYTIMLSLVGIGTGGFGIYIAKGLWDLKPWARTTSLVLLGFVFVGSLGGAIAGKPVPIATLVVSMLFIVYLIRPEVKSSFSGSCASDASDAPDSGS
ncbi:MAG: hypothetical protein H0Z28_01785 [Archaeoglobus sp.]|nr:hypothetical protein [Archaeoglobus sp.]